MRFKREKDAREKDAGHHTWVAHPEDRRGGACLGDYRGADMEGGGRERVCWLGEKGAKKVPATKSGRNLGELGDLLAADTATGWHR